MVDHAFSDVNVAWWAPFDEAQERTPRLISFLVWHTQILSAYHGLPLAHPHIVHYAQAKESS